MIFLYYTTLTLICDVLSSFRLYYIQFKEVKILWGPRFRGQGLEVRAWERGPGNPNTPSWFLKITLFVKNFLNFSEEENFVERVQTTVQGNIFFLMFMSDIFSQSFSWEFDCIGFLLQ